MKKKTILMILDQFFPVDLRVENEALSLINAGFDVDVLTISPYTDSNSINYKGIKVHQVAVSSFTSKKMRGLAAMLPWIDIIISNKVKILNKIRTYDFIHFHDLYTFGAAKRIKKFTDAIFIGDLHENYVDVLEDYQWMKKFPNKCLVSKKKWKQKELEYLTEMQKVIVVNEGMKQKTLEKNVKESDIIIVENMLNTSLFDSYEIDELIINKYKNTFNLLYVGGFLDNRGLEHVIEGMSLLEHKNDINLILVGDGPIRNRLEKLVKLKQLSHKVHFEGWQEQEKIKSYIKSSHIGLIPFKKTEQTDNSSPNKLYQYMYYGLPIVSTDCISIKTIVENNKVGIVYKSEDTEGFVNSVLQLYNNNLESTKFSKNAKLLVKHKYNWNHSVEEMIKMYIRLS